MRAVGPDQELPETAHAYNRPMPTIEPRRMPHTLCVLHII